MSFGKRFGAAQDQITYIGHFGIPARFDNIGAGRFDDQSRPLDPVSRTDMVALKDRRFDKFSTHIGINNVNWLRIIRAYLLADRWQVKCMAYRLNRNGRRDQWFARHQKPET